MAENSVPKVAQFACSTFAKSFYWACMAIGVVTFIIGLATHNNRIWTSYLVSFFFFTSLALGGLFFVSVLWVTNARWSQTIRRVPEAMASTLPWMAVCAVILMLGSHQLFSWLNPNIVAHDHLLQMKYNYYNQPFFIVRMIIYFAVWIFFMRYIVGNSLKQDKSKDTSIIARVVPKAALFLVLFALTYSFFSVDMIMGVQPHWPSTMFGVYTFAGLFQASLALICMLTIWLMKAGYLKGFVNENHLHDLGKFLFAFTIFYAYIAFSQFMLIWYANLPEETIFYLNRMNNGWLIVSVLIAIFKFIVPFFALMPQKAKRTPGHLFGVALIILVMEYVEVYWLIYPNFNNNKIVFSGWEICVLIGMLGLFMTLISRFFSRNSLIPVGDPRLDDAIHHVVIY